MRRSSGTGHIIQAERRAGLDEKITFGQAVIRPEPEILFPFVDERVADSPSNN
jgi:hypothetical protein